MQITIAIFTKLQRDAQRSGLDRCIVDREFFDAPARVFNFFCCSGKSQVDNHGNYGAKYQSSQQKQFLDGQIFQWIQVYWSDGLAMKPFSKGKLVNYHLSLLVTMFYPESYQQFIPNA